MYELIHYRLFVEVEGRGNLCVDKQNGEHAMEYYVAEKNGAYRDIPLRTWWLVGEKAKKHGKVYRPMSFIQSKYLHT